MMPKSASKENAVELLLERHGGSFSDATCFGDDHNDIGLFKKCGKSVAMENSIEEIKALATHHTNSNDDDGVAKYIENFV